jgi:hypothetical protein
MIANLFAVLHIVSEITFLSYIAIYDPSEFRPTVNRHLYHALVGAAIGLTLIIVTTIFLVFILAIASAIKEEEEKQRKQKQQALETPQEVLKKTGRPPTPLKEAGPAIRPTLLKEAGPLPMQQLNHLRQRLAEPLLENS